MSKRKEITLLVRVSVPETMTKREAAREVRTLIGTQCNYDAEPGDIRVKSCGPTEQYYP